MRAPVGEKPEAMDDIIDARAWSDAAQAAREGRPCYEKSAELTAARKQADAAARRARSRLRLVED